MLQNYKIITTDLTSFWFRTWNFGVNFSDKLYLGTYEYYLNPTFNEIYNFQSNGISNMLYLTRGTDSLGTRSVNYSISKTVLWFKNVNQTTTYNLSLYNLTDQGYARVGVFNGTSTIPQCSNQLECNISMLPSNRAIVDSTLTLTEPYAYAVATTIETFNHSRDGKNFALTCTGTGEINVTNLVFIGASQYVYHDGAFVTKNNEDNYIITSCSGWLFSDYDTRKVADLSPTSGSLLTLVAIFLVLSIIFMCGYPAFKNYEEWDTADWVKWAIVSLVIVVFGLIVLTFIFGV
jgi:hypothetical protein